MAGSRAIQSLFVSRVGQFVLRQLKEIWETKFVLSGLILAIRHLFGSFSFFWWGLTKLPTVPFISHPVPQLVFMGGALFIQVSVISLMWAAFRRAQRDQPSPWRDIDIRYVVQLTPTSPLGGLNFLYSRLGPSRRQAIRASPWHFRHTLASVHAGTVIFGMVKFGGLGGLLGVGLLAILFDAVFLLLGQIEAAFGQNVRSLTPRLDYRHKPRVALAAVSQALALAVAFIFTMKDHEWPIYILFVFPMTTVATFLGYLSHGHELEYLNDSISDHALPEAQRPLFCQICQSTILSNALTGPTHHPTADSLYRSASTGCRICAAAWQQRSRVQPDFLAVLMFWKPATTYEAGVSSWTIRYREDPHNLNGCRFQMRQREG